MNFQDFGINGIKEVNAYYARRGGIRTSSVKGSVNIGSFPALMEKASARQTTRTAETAGPRETEQKTSQPVSDNDNICCEKCHAVSQTMLQMLTKNLYSQSALGYSLAGKSPWTSYQTLANLLDRSAL